MDLEQFKILFELHAEGVKSLSTAAERKHGRICSMAATIYGSGDYSYQDAISEARSLYAEATRQEKGKSRG